MWKVPNLHIIPKKKKVFYFLVSSVVNFYYYYFLSSIRCFFWQRLTVIINMNRISLVRFWCFQSNIQSHGVRWHLSIGSMKVKLAIHEALPNGKKKKTYPFFMQLLYISSCTRDYKVSIALIIWFSSILTSRLNSWKKVTWKSWMKCTRNLFLKFSRYV